MVRRRDPEGDPVTAAVCVLGAIAGSALALLLIWAVGELMPA